MADNELLVLLADDDKDDCLLFKEALAELPLTTRITIVHNGEQVMEQLLDITNPLPHVLFLDLNMPRKNGFECLKEIKRNKELDQVFVIILSTSAEDDIVNPLYENRAQHYIRKPSGFIQIKKEIHQALIKVAERNLEEKEILCLQGSCNN